MAIVQISKIQHRSGNLVDLPQLDNAELGWASDQKRLFIGKTNPGPDENVEVLTSYSEISFGQLEGSEGNLNIVAGEDGQVLTYDGNNWVNRGGNAGGLITLGTASNIKIDGGATGYVLETDGTGNLNWTPKGTIVANISNITQANPAVVTTTEENFFVDKAFVTITNVSGMTQVNGNSYYANVLTSNTFSLYSDFALTIPIDSTGYSNYTSGGRVISATGGTAVATAGGSNSQIQFNNTNLLDGDANLTYNFVSKNLILVGNANISNVGVSGLVTVTGNVTSGNLVTGGLLSVTGNANIGNIGTVGTVTATGNVTGGNIATAGIVTATGNVTGGNLITGGLITVIGNANVGNIGTTSVFATANITAPQLISNIATGTAPIIVTSTTQVANLNVATSGTAGTVTTAAQPNITSLGTLTTLSVSGNANIGNIGTAGLITATGNITGGNFTTAGQVSASGNVTVLGIKTDNYYYANGSPISFAGTYSNSNVANYLPTYTGNISAANVTVTAYHVRSVATGITAAGSTQGTATALTKEINVVSTVGAGANGVQLPSAIAGMVLIINNTSATSLNVYPATGAAINSLATNASYSHVSNASLQYYAISSAQWYTTGATYV